MFHLLGYLNSFDINMSLTINFIYMCFCFISNQEGSAFDFGELEQAIVLQGVKIGNDEAKSRMALCSLCSSHLSLFL